MGILLTDDAEGLTKAIHFVDGIRSPESTSAVCFLIELYIMAFDYELSSDERMELNALERECGMNAVRMGDRDRYTDPLENRSYFGISRWLRMFVEKYDERAVLMLAMMSE